jgi:hypothetical protein
VLLGAALLAAFVMGPAPALAMTVDGDGTAELISEDEVRHTQLVLGPMRICLFPTPVSLPASVLQDDVRTSLLQLVTHTMTNEWSYSSMFEYFEFTDATIEWFSSGGANVNGTSAGGSSPCGRLLDRDLTVPFTEMSYQGVVLLLTPEEGSNETVPNITDMESFIGDTIEGGLVESLQNLELSEADSNDEASKEASLSYFEIQVASVSFGGDDDDEEEEVPGTPPVVDGSPDVGGGPQPTPAPQESPTIAPITDPSPPFDFVPAPTAPMPPPKADGVVSGLESSTSSQGGNSAARTAGIVLGSLLAVAALLVLLAHRRRNSSGDRQQERPREYGAEGIDPSLSLDLGESPTTGSAAARNSSRVYWVTDSKRGAPDAEAVSYYGEGTRGGGGGGYAPRQPPPHRHPYGEDGTVVTGEDASEMAQYSQQGEVLESVSVASEWTLGTTEDASSLATRSAVSGNTGRFWKAAERRAATEAFERDRQITLQKDMLQTEWSAAMPVATLPGAGGPAGSNTLSFEQAYDRGQGEEIYLMPPRPLRRSNSQRGGPAIV